MISSIGKSKKGFTLIEVMVTVAVLSLGIIMVYQAFFTAFEAFVYCNDYLSVVSRADEKLWEIQDRLRRTASVEGSETAGEFNVSGRTAVWQAQARPVAALANLTQVSFAVSWMQGKKEKGFGREAYALYTQE